MNKSQTIQPPTHVGALAKRERRLAYVMLLPTFLIVLSIVLGPLLANFWISFKPVQLGDLRAATTLANEQLRPRPKVPGEQVTLRYRIRNSSQKEGIKNVTMRDVLPNGLAVKLNDERCALNGQDLLCDFGDIEAKERFNLEFDAVVSQEYLDNGIRPRDTKAEFTGTSNNVLTSFEFTLDNFRKIFASDEFWSVLKVSLYYTIFGTLFTRIVVAKLSW